MKCGSNGQALINVESAQKLVKVYILIVSCSLWLAHLYSTVNYNQTLRECRGEGAEIIILVERSEAVDENRYEQMMEFIDFFSMQLNIGKEIHQAKVNIMHFEENPIDKISLESFEHFTETLRTTSVYLMRQVDPTDKDLNVYARENFRPKRFCMILTRGQHLYNSDTTPQAVERLWNDNITILAVIFDYPHKVNQIDLHSIVSDPSYTFVKSLVPPHILPKKIIDIICRETKVANQHDITQFNCLDDFPCTVDNLKDSPYARFSHKLNYRFVSCEGVTSCRIDECQVGSLWNNDAKICLKLID